MINEIKLYLQIANRNHLNEDGYKRLVKLLNGEIKDFSTKRTNLITEVDNDQVRLDTRTVQDLLNWYLNLAVEVEVHSWHVRHQQENAMQWN